MWVHCSAAAGRSGVFTSFIKHIRSLLNGLNISDILLDLRRQRLGLVKPPEQLRFVYIIIPTAQQALRFEQITEELKKEVEDEMTAYV